MTAYRPLDDDAPADRKEAQAEIARLAGLDLLDYERERKAAAKKLGLRPTALDQMVNRTRKADDSSQGIAFDNIEVWPEPVDGDALLLDLCQVLRRHLILPEGAAETMALWAVHAHAHDAAYVSPFLTLTSPEKRCGKTTALLMLHRLVPRPAMAASITPSVLFRMIDKYSPTLLIDEADNFIGDNDELRGLLNAGHTRTTAVCWRSVPVGDGFDVQQFSTWGPKAIALIGRMRDTLEDRSIAVPMRRRRPDEKVEQFRADRDLGLGKLARQAARWAVDHLEQLKLHDPQVPAGLHDRAADNWRPLLNVADLAGGEWPETARRVALILSGADDNEDSIGVMLLRDIAGIFDAKRLDRISSGELVDALIEMEERPWPEFRRGKPITQRQVASLLKGYKIAPAVIRLDTRKTPRGYTLEQFKDAFARYIPTQSATTQQTAENRQKSAVSIRNSNDSVADDFELQSAENRDLLHCGGSEALPAAVVPIRPCHLCGFSVERPGEDGVPLSDGSWRHHDCPSF